jgi:hypothetical protein
MGSAQRPQRLVRAARFSDAGELVGLGPVLPQILFQHAGAPGEGRGAPGARGDRHIAAVAESLIAAVRYSFVRGVAVFALSPLWEEGMDVAAKRDDG